MKIKNMLLTAVCICFLCLLGSMQVYAAEYYGNFQYEDNGENVSIYAYNGSDKEVTIPAYINGKAVTEINDYAFLLCNIPDLPFLSYIPNLITNFRLATLERV